MANKGAIVGGVLALFAIIAMLASRKAPLHPVMHICPYCGQTFATQQELNAHIAAAHPSGGAVSFSIRVINLPAEANQWGCAFQDPATGIWYQPTNAPTGVGSHLFSPSQSAELSSPVSSGRLSILASGAITSQMTLPLIAAYQVSLSVINGHAYTFDFATGKIV